MSVIPSFYKQQDHQENLEFKLIEETQQYVCGTSLGELFLGFMNYMAELDTERFCLTIDEKLDRMDDKIYFTREQKQGFQPFIVQDPFDQRNTTYSVHTKKSLKAIKAKFKGTAKIASRLTSLQRLCKPQPEYTAHEMVSGLNLEDID